MRIVFMGSAEIACPAIERLAAMDWICLAGIVTQPDRPCGRTLRVRPCAVAQRMQAAGFPMLRPERVNSPDAVAAIAALRPDLVVVIAYGQILQPALLGVPRLGCINVHASLLPRYRGAAPIQRAVMDGAPETGVTTIWMDAGMDTGDMIQQMKLSIAPAETAGELHERLALLGADVLVNTLGAIRKGDATRVPQDHLSATYAPKLSKTEGVLDWRAPAAVLFNRIRGLNPWPCCYCHMPDGHGHFRRLRVLRSRVDTARGDPGTIVGVAGDGPVIACGEDALCLLQVQPGDRRIMSGQAYACGYAIPIGVKLPCETRAN